MIQVIGGASHAHPPAGEMRVQLEVAERLAREFGSGHDRRALLGQHHALRLEGAIPARGGDAIGGRARHQLFDRPST